MSHQVRVIDGLKFDRIPFDELFAGNEPVLMRGLVAEWPLVQTSRKEGQGRVMELLVSHYNKKPVIVYVGDPEMGGRFSYNDSLNGFNYRAERRDFVEVMNRIRADAGSDVHPYYYMNSLLVDQSFPGLAAENSLVFDHAVFERYPRVGKIWIGTESTAVAHYDVPRNIACCVLGRRRFTLFRPEHIQNLYPGPLDPTPGGQVVTMANIRQPDFDRFPRLREALDDAWVADMEPGDALYYPSLWWHEAEALDRFNVMMNYWWVDSPRYMGDPMDVMMHAMLGLRDRPLVDRQGWRAIFDYYIFGDNAVPRAHLPEHLQGALADMNEENARRIRDVVAHSLKR